jgi:hypothetical protein
MADINPYLAQTIRMSPAEWNLYSGFLDTQAGMMGLPDGDSLSRDQLSTAMAMWQIPKAFGRGFGLTLGLLGGVALGLALGYLIARRRNIAQAAQQAQPPGWW